MEDDGARKLVKPEPEIDYLELLGERANEPAKIQFAILRANGWTAVEAAGALDINSHTAYNWSHEDWYRTIFNDEVNRIVRERQKEVDKLFPLALNNARKFLLAGDRPLTIRIINQEIGEPPKTPPMEDEKISELRKLQADLMELAKERALPRIQIDKPKEEEDGR